MVDDELEQQSGSLDADRVRGRNAAVPEVRLRAPWRTGAAVDHIRDWIDEGEAAGVAVADILECEASFGNTKLE